MRLIETAWPVGLGNQNVRLLLPTGCRVRSKSKNNNVEPYIFISNSKHLAQINPKLLCNHSALLFPSIPSNTLLNQETISYASLVDLYMISKAAIRAAMARLLEFTWVKYRQPVTLFITLVPDCELGIASKIKNRYQRHLCGPTAVIHHRHRDSLGSLRCASISGTVWHLPREQSAIRQGTVAAGPPGWYRDGIAPAGYHPN